MAAKVDNREAFQYHRDILPQFQSIYDPILETGLFSFVGYFRMYGGGKYLFPVGKNPEIIESYIKNVPNQGIYYLDQLKRIKNLSLANWPERFSQGDPPLAHLTYLGLSQGISIYKRFPEYIEGIYLCSQHSAVNLDALAVAQSHLLQDIRQTISDKASHILKTKNSVFAQFQDSFDISPHPEDVLIQEKMEILLKKLKEDHFVDALAGKRDVSLTNRQVQTILASIHGQSSKEAAQKLNITYRTVEDHWATIHRKFQHTTGSVYSRSQIIETFLEEADTYLNTGLSRDLIQEIDTYRRSLSDLRRQGQRTCLKERGP